MSELLVKSAKHKTSHILDIEFSDGYHACVDFSIFIFSSGHPDYEKYKSVDKFLKFEIIDDNLNWDDYTMIFPIEDLYKTKLVENR